jgi:hypothetical protein
MMSCRDDTQLCCPSLISYGNFRLLRDAARRDIARYFQRQWSPTFFLSRAGYGGVQRPTEGNPKAHFDNFDTPVKSVELCRIVSNLIIAIK